MKRLLPSIFRKLNIPLILLAILFLGITYWFLNQQYDQFRTVTYVIPAGTSANPEQLTLPSVIELQVGVKDILVIDNQDEVVHNFGPFAVPPQAQTRQRFDRPMEFTGECSFHPDQGMTLIVRPAPWDIF